VRNLVVHSLSSNSLVRDTLDWLAIPIALNKLRSYVAEVCRDALEQDARRQDHGGRGFGNAHGDINESKSVVNERGPIQEDRKSDCFVTATRWGRYSDSKYARRIQASK
jgi:hypothetical protein